MIRAGNPFTGLLKIQIESIDEFKSNEIPLTQTIDGVEGDTSDAGVPGKTLLPGVTQPPLGSPRAIGMVLL